MKLRKHYFILLIVIVCLLGCKSYLIDKESAAQQMTNVKVERKTHGFGYKNVGSGYYYSSNLKYFIIKNESSQYDTIFPFEIKFFLKSGINTGWMGGADQTIFKNNYFIAIHDSTIKTNYKHKFNRVHIDSLEKIMIRGSRMNKIKNNK